MCTCSPIWWACRTAPISPGCANWSGTFARDEKMARQQQRLQDMAQERIALQRGLDQARSELRQVARPAVAIGSDEDVVATLRLKLGDEKAHGAALAARLAEREQRLATLSHMLEDSRTHAARLEQEIAALEALMDEPGAAQAAGGARLPLAGRTRLYVGGLSRLTEHLRALAARTGAILLTHDGGKQETTSLLPGLVSQADLCLFPVDCVIHLAAAQIKQLCAEAGKPFIPLRAPSLASFAAALADLAPVAEAAE